MNSSKNSMSFFHNYYLFTFTSYFFLISNYFTFNNASLFEKRYTHMHNFLIAVFYEIIIIIINFYLLQSFLSFHFQFFYYFSLFYFTLSKTKKKLFLLGLPLKSITPITVLSSTFLNTSMIGNWS